MTQAVDFENPTKSKPKPGFMDTLTGCLVGGPVVLIYLVWKILRWLWWDSIARLGLVAVAVVWLTRQYAPESAALVLKWIVPVLAGTIFLKALLWLIRAPMTKATALYWDAASHILIYGYEAPVIFAGKRRYVFQTDVKLADAAPWCEPGYTFPVRYNKLHPETHTVEHSIPSSQLFAPHVLPFTAKRASRAAENRQVLPESGVPNKTSP